MIALACAAIGVGVGVGVGVGGCEWGNIFYFIFPFFSLLHFATEGTYVCKYVSTM